MEHDPSSAFNPDQQPDLEQAVVPPQPDQDQGDELDEAAVREKIAKEEQRITAAESTVEKLDHKDALYGHVGATMLEGVEITGPDGEPIERPLSRSMAERIKVRRMTKRDVKQARKASELSSRDKLLGKKTVSTGTVSKIDRVIQLGKLKKQFGAGEIDEREYHGRRFDIKAGKTSERTRVTRHVQAGGVLYQSGREQLSANEPIASRIRAGKRAKAEGVISDGETSIESYNEQLIAAGLEPHIRQVPVTSSENQPFDAPEVRPNTIDVNTIMTALSEKSYLDSLRPRIQAAVDTLKRQYGINEFQLRGNNRLQNDLTIGAIDIVTKEIASEHVVATEEWRDPEWWDIHVQLKDAYLNHLMEEQGQAETQRQNSQRTANRPDRAQQQRQSSPTPRPPQRRQLSPEEQIAQLIAQESRDSGESLDVVEPRVRAEYEAEQRRAAQAVADNAARTAIES